jgi:Chaperone of endosialidase
VNDAWIPGPPKPPPQWVVSPLPPSNEWNNTEGCDAPAGPAIVQGITITGVPATITAPGAWRITLNSPPDFTIDRLDSSGNLIDSPLDLSAADGSAYFPNPVYLSADPVAPLEAATKQYVDAHTAGIPEPPDNQTYGRTDGAWNLVVPAAGGTFTGVTNFSAGGAVTSGAMLFAGSAVCSIPTIAQLNIGGGALGQVPATDGNGNLSWVTPVTGGPYLPLTGGTITGNLTVNQVLTVQGSNSMVLNAPVTGGNQRAILSQASSITRWQLILGDQTTEGTGNTGTNFSLSAYSATGSYLGAWLTIARADGSTVFNGSGVTIQGGLAVNGLLALSSPNNLAIYGGLNGQVLTTDGGGILSWTTPSSGGGIPEAPTDGTGYVRQSAAWTNNPWFTGMNVGPIGASSSDVVATYLPPTGQQVRQVVHYSSSNPDWTNYYSGTQAWFTARTTAGGEVPIWTVTLPSVTFTFGVPVILAANPTVPLGAATKQYVDAAVPAPSNANPAMAGTAAPGTAATFARADHVHPTDTSRAAASALAGYLPLAGGTLTGNLSLSLAAPVLVLRKNASGSDTEILGTTGANARWLIQMGNGTAETGGNVGSDWGLSRYNDAGGYLDTPVQVYRSTGAVQVGAGGFGIGRNDGGAGGVLNGANIGLSLASGINVETSSGNACALLNRISTNGGIMSFRQSNGICGNISVANGNSCTFNSGSDARLKMDEHNDFDAGPILDAIQVYDFQWTTNGERAYGVMAQECNEVFPDAVHHDAEEDWWGVDYSKFVPLLLQEIKALRQRVAALEAMVIP